MTAPNELLRRFIEAVRDRKPELARAARRRLESHYGLAVDAQVRSGGRPTYRLVPLRKGVR